MIPFPDLRLSGVVLLLTALLWANQYEVTLLVWLLSETTKHVGSPTIRIKMRTLGR